MSNFSEMEVKSPEKGTFFSFSSVAQGTSGLMEKFELHADY